MSQMLTLCGLDAIIMYAKLCVYYMLAVIYCPVGNNRSYLVLAKTVDPKSTRFTVTLVILTTRIITLIGMRRIISSDD